MLLIVDANILCSVLIAGRLTDLLFSPRLELVAPELVFAEMKKHNGELQEKSKLSVEEFDVLISLLERRVRTIPLDEFSCFFPKAEELLGDHRKDAEYIALALHLSCPFWTYEKRLLNLRDIKVITTEELARMLRE